MMQQFHDFGFILNDFKLTLVEFRFVHDFHSEKFFFDFVLAFEDFGITALANLLHHLIVLIRIGP